MVEIIPFRGLRYNPEKVELKKVVAPPYDVISDDARNKYYKNKHSVVRLILGKEFKRDSPKNNRYTRAAEYLRKWAEGGVLKTDSEPSIYAYEEKYAYNGKTKRMLGFIALAKLEPFSRGVILPHEETLPEPIEDRLKLIRACRANFSPIFAMYSDPRMAVEKLIKSDTKKKPVANIEAEGVRHRIWRISGKSVIEKVASEMKNKAVFIADGHHRYETALKFMNETGGKNNYVMMYFTNADSGGATILPAHRLLKGDSSASKISGIERYFKVTAVDFNYGSEAAQRKKLLRLMAQRSSRHAFGMYRGKRRYYLLVLKDEKILDGMVKARKSQSWKKLDVVIAHSLLIGRILKVKPKDITYVVGAEKAVQLVKNGEYEVAIFLNPTKLQEVKKIALAGERMPGKATYFYPKLLTGLVMNKM